MNRSLLWHFLIEFYEKLKSFFISIHNLQYPSFLILRHNIRRVDIYSFVKAAYGFLVVVLRRVGQT
jgi:hypothetical protein